MVKFMKVNKKRLFLLCVIVVLILVGLCFLFKGISKEKKDNELLMPNFVSKNINDFKTFADENNINYEIKEEYNSKHEKNIIISQSVSENTKIDASTKVELTVSLGRISNDILKVDPSSDYTAFYAEYKRKLENLDARRETPSIVIEEGVL